MNRSGDTASSQKTGFSADRMTEFTTPWIYSRAAPTIQLTDTAGDHADT
jgi:hypothetical protein